MKSFFFGICCSLISIAGAQNPRLDSLLLVSKSQKSDALIQTYNEISWEYRNSSADSALHYARLAYQISKDGANQLGEAQSLNSIAAAFEATGVLDSAEVYHNRGLNIKLAINDTIGIADTYNNLGIIHDTRGDFSKALQNYFLALGIYEKHATDENKVPMVLVNIGIVYKKQKEYQKVLEYYQKALDIYKRTKNDIGRVITTGNIGSVLLNLEDYERSIEYSEEAMKTYATLGYIRYVPYMQVNIAIARDSLKQYEAARKDYLESISAFERDQNLYELSNAKVALAKNYARDQQFQQARRQLQEALSIINDQDYKEIRVKALKQMAETDAASGRYADAFKNYKRYAVEKDSLFESEKTKTIFELETKYETEKNEREINAQRANIAEQELKLNKKNTQLAGLGLLALVFALIGHLFYNQQKLKNIQLRKENELKDALVKIETQNRLQDQRLRISRDLHDNIGAQLTFIISSIDNLKYGFELPQNLGNKLEGISSFTSSTIYELRDTIWAMNKQEISFEDLQSRISNFIEKAGVSQDQTTFKFEAPKSVETNFTSVQGMNIYRIIQEAVNNAIKYANASTIEVSIDQSPNEMNVTISDNGQGFDIEKVERGNGLQNMTKRTKELGGDLKVVSSSDSGTKVILTLPSNT